MTQQDANSQTRQIAEYERQHRQRSAKMLSDQIQFVVPPTAAAVIFVILMIAIPLLVM